MKAEVELFISDVHLPYQDKQALSIVHQWIMENKPSRIVLGGDIVDFAPISSFDKSPTTATKWQEHKELAQKEIEFIRRISPNSQMLWLEGNHCHRLIRYLWNKAPELASESSLSIPKLFNLDQLDIQWIPEDEPITIGKLLHLHGHQRAVGATHPAKGLYDKLGTNVICGHYHKFQRYSARTMPDETKGVFVNACLCGLYPDYMLFPQWEHGFSVIQYLPSGAFSISQINILMDKHLKRKFAMYNGQIYYSDKVVQLTF